MKGEMQMYGHFSKQQKGQMITRLRQYFSEERGETIGELAAENFLHFITEEIGPFYYNEGLRDARKTVDERMAAIEEDLLSLQRPIE